ALLGKRTRPAPLCLSRAKRVRPPRSTSSRRTEPSVRGSQFVLCSTADRFLPWPRSNRKVTPNLGLNHGCSLAGKHHLAAFHHRVGIGELARKLEVLFDEDDRHLALIAQKFDGAPYVLDDGGLNALGRLI